MKKILMLVFLVFILCMIPVTANANSGPPPTYFYCEIQNPLAGTVYRDLLIEINEQDEDFDPFRDQINEIAEDSPIATYNQDGYMSFYFHYNNGYIDSMYYDVGVFSMTDSNLTMDKVSPTVKVVLLDEVGNIMRISKTISTEPPSSDYFARRIIYDAKDDVVTMEFENYYNGSTESAVTKPDRSERMISWENAESAANSLEVSAGSEQSDSLAETNENEAATASYHMPLLLILLLRMILSVVVETAAAIPFKLKPLWKITAVNIVTQIVFIVFMRNISMPYVSALIIGEIFVYLSEFIAYISLFRTISKWKLAIYTAAANTITLIIGLIMNALHILV